jgi:hypothetical protein
MTRWVAAPVVLLGLLGSIGYVAVTHTHAAATSPRPAPLAVETCDTSDAGAGVSKIRVGTLTKRHSTLVDVAEGQPPSPEMPAGTVFVAAASDNHGTNRPTLYGWDVSRARVTFSANIKFESDKVYTGDPSAMRVAVGGKYVYVVTELEQGHSVLLNAFDHAGASRGQTAFAGGSQTTFTTASEASVAAAESWVAVAYRPSFNAKVEVHLLSTPTRGWPEIAKRQIDADTLTKGQRPSALAFLDDRLYVAERVSPTETRVSELALPSLNVLKSYSSHHEKVTKLDRSQLFASGHWLYLLDRGTLIQLGADLFEKSKKEIATDEVAIGPAPSYEVLTTLGLGAPGVRGDFVKAMDNDASCTPAWSGAYPMLACAVDMEGALVARFPATDPKR